MSAYSARQTKRKRREVEDCPRMAESAPGRKESGLHTGDRIEQAHRLQVVEVGYT